MTSKQNKDQSSQPQESQIESKKQQKKTNKPFAKILSICKKIVISFKNKIKSGITKSFLFTKKVAHFISKLYNDYAPQYLKNLTHKREEIDGELVTINDNDQLQDDTTNNNRVVEGTLLSKDGAKLPILQWIKNSKAFQNLKSTIHAIKLFLFAQTPDEARYRKKIEENLDKHIRPVVVFGGTIMIIGIAFFIIWGSLAPLDSAVVSEGTIVLSGNRKTIQHLEGGVIEEIYAHDGQTVKNDQELIKLRNTHTMAHVRMILSQLQYAKAFERRLIAEEQSLDTVNYEHDSILDLSTPEVQNLIKNQNDLFALNKKALEIQLDVYNQKTLQKKEEVNGLLASQKAIITRKASAKEQLRISKELYSKGLETKIRMLQLQERYEEIDGQTYSIKATIAKVSEEIAETELHKINALNDYKQKTAEKYKENHMHVLELEQKLQSAEDTLKRATIRATSSGIVMGLQYHTIGGVIPPGSKIMDIVPQNDKLIVEAYVAPQFIENLHIGLAVKVQLNAYKSRLVPRVAGKVTHVSADKFINQNNGQSFYTIKIQLSEESIAKINTDIKLYPGMPVTVFIVRGNRTFLQYLLSPIVDSFHRAFKEA